MSGNPGSTPKEWVGGDQFAPNELTALFGIPREELASFQAFIRIYPRNAVIIEEGAVERSLYLLRSGAVTIWRKMGAQPELLAKIEAVNFMGEMALFNDEPRSATVKAFSEQVLVYAFARPNFNVILSNPKWAELLISRLSKNLAQNNAMLVNSAAAIQDLRGENARLQTEIESQRLSARQLVHQFEKTLGAVLQFQNVTRDLAVVGSKGWAYLKALNDVTRALAAHYLPEAIVSEKHAETEVMQKCLTSVQTNTPSGIFDDLYKSL